MARNADIIGEQRSAVPTSEQYSVFRAYLDRRHRHGGMADMTVLDYAMMVEDSHVETRIIEYRKRGPDSGITGRGEELIAVALTDVLSDGLSMVYSFFEPSAQDRSLGTFMILDHIARARRLGLPYVYLGYWIEGSKKMDYKGRFLPQQRLAPSGWLRVDASGEVRPSRRTEPLGIAWISQNTKVSGIASSWSPAAPAALARSSSRPSPRTAPRSPSSISTRTPVRRWQGRWPARRHAPLFLRCDVTRTDRPQGCDRPRCGRSSGPASALINNAANDQRQTFADVTPDDFDRTMAVNFRHTYFASQAVVPQMIERGGGSIVNMSSITWQIGAPDLMGYAVGQGRRRRLHAFARASGRASTASASTRLRRVSCSRRSSSVCGIRPPEKVAEVVNNQFIARRRHAQPISPTWRCFWPPTTAA